MDEERIHEMVFAAAENYPYRPALWLRSAEGFKPLNYRDLANQIFGVAAGLARLGMKPGSRIAIYAPNSPAWCIAYLATLTAGAVVVPLDARLKYLELKTAIAEAQLSALFAPEAQREELLDLSSLTPPHPEIISLDGSGESGISLVKLGELDDVDAFKPPVVDPHTMSVLIFTSGTSGDCKGVMLSHHNIMADVRACQAYIPITPEDRFLSVLPLHHTFEATCGFIYPLSVGASIGHVESLKSAQIASDLSKLEASMMCAVPLLYEKMHLRLKRGLAQAPRAKRIYVSVGLAINRLTKKLLGMSMAKTIFRPLRVKAGLGTIRFLVSGGAALDPAVSAFFCDLGIDLLQGYGLTETSPVLSVNRADDNRNSSVGRPLPGVQIKIIDKDENGIGEIAAKGEMVMLGYYGKEGETAAVFEEGFFKTGDLGWLDSDGFLYIAGRKKNVIITAAGKNIYPEEIEFEIDKSPYVLESAVLPRPRGTGEEPIAVVVPDRETLGTTHGELQALEVQKLLTAEVLSACNRLAEYKRVKRVIVLNEELPKTTTKKIKKHLVAETLRSMGEL